MFSKSQLIWKCIEEERKTRQFNSTQKAQHLFRQGNFFTPTIAGEHQIYNYCLARKSKICSDVWLQACPINVFISSCRLLASPSCISAIEILLSTIYSFSLAKHIFPQLLLLRSIFYDSAGKESNAKVIKKSGLKTWQIGHILYKNIYNDINVYLSNLTFFTMMSKSLL